MDIIIKSKMLLKQDYGLILKKSDKRDKRDKRAFICSHFSFIGDEQREALLRSLNLLK